MSHVIIFKFLFFSASAGLVFCLDGFSLPSRLRHAILLCSDDKWHYVVKAEGKANGTQSYGNIPGQNINRVADGRKQSANTAGQMLTNTLNDKNVAKKVMLVDAELVCEPRCGAPCLNGGRCVAPDVCQCREGFHGSDCGRRVPEECSQLPNPTPNAALHLRLFYQNIMFDV